MDTEEEAATKARDWDTRITAGAKGFLQTVVHVLVWELVYSKMRMSGYVRPTETLREGWDREKHQHKLGVSDEMIR